jgi:predicted transcriptional regulator
MEHLSSYMGHHSNQNQEQQNQQVQWRRDKVQELCSKGYSQREISQVLQIGLATVNRDISYLRDQSKANIKRYIDERLPEEYEKCLVGLTAITKEAWNTAANTEDKREKIQALSLAKECYSMKLDLLTNATVVDDAIRFVSDKSKDKDKLKSSLNNNKEDKEESEEPDYDEDGDELEQKQEETQETGKITAAITTTNQIF